jgi:FMN phosphatase YigB (HAD superfamily)
MDFSSIRLITFDCYGTLIDWETGILNSLRSLLRNLPPVEDEKLIEIYAEIEPQWDALRRRLDAAWERPLGQATPRDLPTR